MFKLVHTLVVVGAFLFPALSVAAQSKTATQFYDDYRVFYAKAKSFNDLLPWMSKAQNDKFATIPEEQRKMMWAVAKEMEVTDIKVVKETVTAEGAKLEVTGMGPEKKMIKGTIDLVKEEGAWKINQETWQM